MDTNKWVVIQLYHHDEKNTNEYITFYKSKVKRNVFRVGYIWDGQYHSHCNKNIETRQIKYICNIKTSTGTVPIRNRCGRLPPDRWRPPAVTGERIQSDVYS